ncbi:MAG: NUDIX domain-containing protein [Thermoplasmata archaeon]
MEEPSGPVARECVEGYLYAEGPFALLLFRRTPARGQIWVPVSGKVEPTDPDLESAVRRELVEETGLLRPRRIFPLDWQVKFRADNGEVWRLHAYGVEVERSFEPVLSAEHEASRWMGEEEALGLLHFEDNRAAVRRLADRRPDRGTPNV